MGGPCLEEVRLLGAALKSDHVAYSVNVLMRASGYPFYRARQLLDRFCQWAYDDDLYPTQAT